MAVGLLPLPIILRQRRFGRCRSVMGSFETIKDNSYGPKTRDRDNKGCYLRRQLNPYMLFPASSHLLTESQLPYHILVL